MDCGLTMQVSCLKRKSNMVAGAQWDIPGCRSVPLSFLFLVWKTQANHWTKQILNN